MDKGSGHLQKAERNEDCPGAGPGNRQGIEAMSIIGLGPHGERAQPAESLRISEEDGATARARQFQVAVVLHSTNSDWAKQQLAGIVKTLGDYSAILSEVVDCGFSSETQIAALARLQRVKPDAIISFPVGNAVVARAHREVTIAGIKLILIDNAPTGLLPGVDYVGVVSADNFHLGQIAAKLLSPHVPRDRVVGVLTYGTDFFVTNEREIAFRKWMETHRSDLLLKIARFADAGDVVAALDQLLDTNPQPAGLFVSWDKPAMQAVEELRRRKSTCR